MNMGHGHVTPNEFGMKARCGGPAICAECALELASANNETGYDRVKRLRQESFNSHVSELEKLADENKDRIHYLSQEAYKCGIAFAVKEIEGWESLLIKAHEGCPYSNPKEADREHRNQMNLLATIKSKLVARFQGKP